MKHRLEKNQLKKANLGWQRVNRLRRSVCCPIGWIENWPRSCRKAAKTSMFSPPSI